VRRTVLLFTAIVLMLTATASAQFLGQMSPASVLPTNAGKVGGYIVSAENAFAVVGSFRYGFSPFTEGRFRLGFIDEDGPHTDPHVIMGVDAKFLLWKFSEGTSGSSSPGAYRNPIDLSLGASMEYAALERSDVLGMGGSAIASRPFEFTNGSSIEPYARLNLRYQRVGYDDYYDNNVRVSGGSDSDFKVGLNVGALFSVTPLVDFTAEFQLDNSNAFMLGIDIAAF
jgi:hypothetical protein